MPWNPLGRSSAGSIVPANWELRAVYVDAAYGGQGVGRAPILGNRRAGIKLDGDWRRRLESQLEYIAVVVHSNAFDTGYLPRRRSVELDIQGRAGKDCTGEDRVPEDVGHKKAFPINAIPLGRQFTCRWVVLPHWCPIATANFTPL